MNATPPEKATVPPEAVRAWFYPGDLFGNEFVYPRNRAIELAQATKQNVPAMPNEMAENITKPVKSKTEPSAVALEHSHLTAATPEKKEVEVAKAIQTKPLVAENRAPKRLPKTASRTPLVALAGALALGAASGLGLLVKRRGETCGSPPATFQARPSRARQE